MDLVRDSMALMSDHMAWSLLVFHSDHVDGYQTGRIYGLVDIASYLPIVDVRALVRWTENSHLVLGVQDGWPDEPYECQS